MLTFPTSAHDYGWIRGLRHSVYSPSIRRDKVLRTESAWCHGEIELIEAISRAVGIVSHSFVPVNVIQNHPTEDVHTELSDLQGVVVRETYSRTLECRRNTSCKEE